MEILVDTIVSARITLVEGSLIVGGIAIILFGMYQFFNFPKTVFLISKVTPYEQSGTAGKILVIGDSTGYGTGAATSEESIAGRIGKDFPQYTIENRSQNGRKIASALEVAEEVAGEYDLILLQIGANDLLANRPIAEVLKAMQALISSVSAHAGKVVVMTSGNIGGASRFSDKKAQQYEQISRLYADKMILLAKENGFTYIDLFEEPEDDVFVQEPKVYLANDGLHPSSAGYSVWYEKLKPILEESLNK